MTRDEMLTQMTKEFIAQGRLIEAGWIGMQLTSIAPDAPQIQLDEMRMAFFAGAQHLWGSLNNVLDPEGDVTDDDLVRMESIHHELQTFIAEFEKKHGLTGGRAQ